jgi:indolepyruvate ferredoxin oxidoreductase alpha subunit
VTGGALIIIGEDYGEGSSIMQERTHAFAMKSQVWLLDPRPNLPKIVEMVEQAFELSEASNTPVMLELRIRACHLFGRFTTKDNVRPAFTQRDALENPVREVDRIVLPPASFLHEREKIERRWPAAVEFIKQRKLNEVFGPADGDVGVIVQGGLYNGLMRALERLGLADVFGETTLPVYCLNVAYPLIHDEVKAFCAGKRAVLLVEEGQPEFIEQALNTMLRQADIATRVVGKEALPRAGEYTAEVLQRGLRNFLKTHAPGINPSAAAPGGSNEDLAALAEALPVRPPGFCTGCPERPIFTAMKLVERETGPFHVSADIGCHLFSILPPFNIGNTTMGYGLGQAGSAAFNVKADRKALAVMGDGGFWHNGLTSGIGNAVFNQSDNVTLIVDNNYSAATGGQDLPSSKSENAIRSTKHAIADAVRGVGVKWVRQVDRTYDLKAMTGALRDALTSAAPGPKVVIAQSECMLNRQRREKPQFNAAVKRGERKVRERFGVDPDTCTGDHSCIRLSGCPSLTVKPNPDHLRRDPIAHVENSCVGCGLCGEVSHAAVLCPSFYRAEIVFNPSRADRLLAGVRRAVIGWLQGLADRRRLARAL